MGAKDGWLHDSSIVLLARFYDFLAASPDLILQECTPAFDEIAFGRILEHAYHLDKTMLDPR
eukprot:4284709-Alexandrium_andersonii.AAC.1